jgi:hypothetical protein
MSIYWDRVRDHKGTIWKRLDRLRELRERVKKHLVREYQDKRGTTEKE